MRFSFCSILILSFFLSGCADLPDKYQKDNILYVRYDPGGKMFEREDEVAHLTQSGIAVSVPDNGECLSACTLYLAVPESCVSSKSRLGFHGPYYKEKDENGNEKKMTRYHFEKYSRKIATYYPAPLAKWYLDTGRHVHKDFIYKSGSELIRDFGVPECIGKFSSIQPAS